MRYLFAFSLITILLFGIVSCSNCISGEGESEIINVPLEPITALKISTSADVVIKQGPVQKVEVETHRSVYEVLNKEVVNGLWNIYFEQCFNGTVNISITVPDLNQIEIAGSGDCTGTTNFNTDQMYIKINGSGDVDVKLNCQKIVSEVSGSGDITLAGSATSHKISINGSGSVDAGELAAVDAEVKVSGSGDVKVNATNILNATIAGSGNISYQGNPVQVKSEVLGSGEIKKL